MEQVETQAPLRVMLVCCDQLVPQLLQDYLANTEWWQLADGDICYGKLELHALVLTAVDMTLPCPLAMAVAAPRFAGMQLERVSAIRRQHHWFLPAAAMARLQLLALQHDWLVFVEPQQLADTAPLGLQRDPAQSAALRDHLNSMAMLQLLVAEHLHTALMGCATLTSSASPPVFIQCQWDQKPADLPNFYQQLDINSRWQSLIYCRWLLTCPAVTNAATPPEAAAQQQTESLVAQLYLLLLAGLPSDIGPWLNDLAPRYLAAIAPACRLAQPGWLDWQVLIGETLQAPFAGSCATEPAIQYQLASASAYNADLQLTAIAVQQGSVLDSSPMLNGQPCSHHLFSQLRVCVKQLPAHLPLGHLLLLQSAKPRPQWQLQGYWRLQLV